MKQPNQQPHRLTKEAPAPSKQQQQQQQQQQQTAMAQKKSRPMKRVADSECCVAEIVGEEALRGKRMQAGSVLDLMDIVAGRVAFQHSGSRVATLSFDQVDLSYPIMHMDLVRLEGKLVFVGNSSMIVNVCCYRHDPQTREFILLQRSFITMVAIQRNGRPNKNIPGLLYESEAEIKLRDEWLERRKLANKWIEMQSAADVVVGNSSSISVNNNTGTTTTTTTLTVAQVMAIDRNNQYFHQRPKREYLTSAETEIELKRQFFPKDLNHNNTIFGGNILVWMDKLATYTARNFTGNPNMLTIAMNRIFFKKPVYSTDLVQMKARVVYVRNYTLEVEIKVFTQRRVKKQSFINGGAGSEHYQLVTEPSHTGYFRVMNFDQAARRCPIMTGLKLSDEDQEGLLSYVNAVQRHKFFRQYDKVTRSRHSKAPGSAAAAAAGGGGGTSGGQVPTMTTATMHASDSSSSSSNNNNNNNENQNQNQNNNDDDDDDDGMYCHLQSAGQYRSKM